MFQNRSGISLLGYTQVLVAFCEGITSWINVASAEGCPVNALSRKGCPVHLLTLESCMQNPTKNSPACKGLLDCSYHENERQSVCAWSSSFVDKCKYRIGNVIRKQL